MSDGLKNKMYDFEVTPPAIVWGKIEAALDDAALLHEFPRTLHGMEVTPPPAVWGRIIDTLDEKSVEPSRSAKVVAFPFLRYAAAAAIIGLIIFASLRFFNKTSDKKDLAIKEPVSKELEKPSLVNPSIITGTKDSNEVTKDVAIVSNNDRLIARVDLPVKNRNKNNLRPFSQSMNFSSSFTATVPEDAIHELHYASAATALVHENIQNNIASRYIMLMTPDGNIIRMSKKLSDLVCCVSGEAQDDGCKDQLQRWREKMASSPGVSSPGNFMDILSIVNSLQEGQL